MTRLTNAFSKTADHHAATMAIFVAFYNFRRKHETLNGRTLARAAGLADRVWSVGDLLAAIAA